MSDLPRDLEQTLETACLRAQVVPGFMAENEIRFLAAVAACVPAKGSVVEIGSFKGKSTVALATVAAQYNLGAVVAIDPHMGLSYLGPEMPQQSPTFEEFLSSIRTATVDQYVEVRRATSRDVAKDWTRPIRMLWIDGDHSYAGCKEDFDLFSPFLSDGAIIAFHDTLNAFDGPIRVFVEDVLNSDAFGPSGFVHSIGWAQYRPRDGKLYRKQRDRLEQRAERLIPFVSDGTPPKGIRKIAYKLNRSRVPRKLISPTQLLKMLDCKLE